MRCDCTVPRGPSASRCGEMSSCTVLPDRRGETAKPVSASCTTKVSWETTPPGVRMSWRCGSVRDCPVEIQAVPPSTTWRRWSMRSVAPACVSCARSSTREPRLLMVPPAATSRLEDCSASSKRTRICSRREGRSMASSACLISARFSGLVRTKSCPDCPDSVAPGSSSGRSAGSTWSTVRCFNGMISSAPCAHACIAQRKVIANPDRINAISSLFCSINALACAAPTTDIDNYSH